MAWTTNFPSTEAPTAVTACRRGGGRPMNPDQAVSGPRLLRIRAVREMTGLTEATLYRRMGAGAFPLPVRISPHAVAWHESKILQWMASLKTAVIRTK